MDWKSFLKEIGVIKTRYAYNGDMDGVDNYTYQYSGLGDRIQQTDNGVTTTYVLDLNAA